MRVGQRVGGRFLLERQLAGGNRTNEVWLARDERLERPIVLKRDLRTDPRATSQLAGEQKAMAAFNHPNVITLYEVTTIDDVDWLVMEYAPAGSLAEAPRMSAARAAAIGAQVASALVALHAKSIVHCDVKPANIVIAENGAAKLTDFGAAYRVGSPRGRVSYTAAYAAPEVVAGNPEPKSDVYSLASTLHELVAGAPARRETGTGVRPIADAPRIEVGGPLREVLAAMSRPDPADRPDAATVQRSLESPERPARRRVPVALAAAALAVLLTAADAPDTGRLTSIIGEARTADPCAMVDETLFHRFGETYLDPDYGSFERCDVIVTQADGVEADVEVSFDSRPPPEQAPVRKLSGVDVVVFPVEDGDCDRVLLLPDGTVDATVWVSVDADGPAPLCEMADVGAEFAAKQLAAGPLPRRSPPLPANSLVWRDACALLDARQLSIVPGVYAGDPDIDFANWGCEWNSTTDDLYLAVSFDRGSPPTAEDGRLTRIAGHDAIVMPESDGEETCTVLVEYRDYSDIDGDPAVEMLRVDIDRESPTEQLCAMITELAEAATIALRGDRQ